MITFEIKELEDAEFKECVPKVWYWPWVRAFLGWDTEGPIVYINKDARFVFPWSREDLILHEVGHILGYEHRWAGVMAWHGLFRM